MTGFARSEGHNDTSADLDAMGLLRAREDISDVAKEKILSHNPTALFGLDLAA